MELRDYLRVISERWLSITACVLAALAAAGVVSSNITPVYEARAQMFVSVQSSPSKSVGELAQGNIFTQQRVKSYAALVTSPRVLQPVIRTLGLNTSVGELAQHVSAEAPLDTVLIDVTVRDTSPERAAAIADTVSSTLSTVVSDLERPAGQSTSPVRVSQTQDAVVPSEPVSPNIPLNLAIALVLGLSVGIGIGLLRQSLDTRVKGAEDLERIGAPALVGAIVSSRGEDRIKLNPDARDVRAETFRHLRTNLQFISVDAPPRCIVLTSAVPGEGKTTVACNLAVSLAQAGHSVALVDGDLRRPRIAGHFGVESAAGVTNVLIGQAALSDVLQPIGDHRLSVLASGPTPPNPSELLGSHSMHQLLTELRSRFDYVLVDTPPLLPVTDAAVLAKLADGALVVVHAAATRREQLARSLSALHSVDARVLGTVLNRVPGKGRDSYSYGYYYYAPRTKKQGRMSKLGQALGLVADETPRSRTRASSNGHAGQQVGQHAGHHTGQHAGQHDGRSNGATTVTAGAARHSEVTLPEAERTTSKR